MNTDLNAERASLALETGQGSVFKTAANLAAAKKTAQDFEGVFLSQMLGEMFASVPTDETFGGGPGEDMFRSLMVNEYGKEMAAHGGIGLAKSVLNEMIAMQEARQ